MKKLAFLLALVMLVSVFAACATDDGANDTNDSTDAPETDAPGTDAPETNAPETEEPEDTTPPETEPPLDLPAQGDVPCNFDDAIDLSSDILVSEFMLNDGSGQWILGDDATPMVNIITEDMLNEYKYIAFKYNCDYSEETYTISVMLKLLHTDGTKTEFLCNEWYGWGPAGATYYSHDLGSMGVYCPSGVVYVATADILAHESFQEGDVIDQMGIASVPETFTIPYLEITGAYLTK